MIKNSRGESIKGQVRNMIAVEDASQIKVGEITIIHHGRNGEEVGEVDECFAYSMKVNFTNYYVKFYAEGPYAGRMANPLLKDMSKAKFRPVTKNCFDSYVNYLISKNARSLESAENYYATETIK